MERYNITGLNLDIDQSIYEICEAANDTSGNTRSVLYTLVIVNILALIAVFNSYNTPWTKNWTNARIEKNREDIDSLLRIFPKMVATDGYYDSINTNFFLELKKTRLENNLRNQMENVHHVKIPILGNSFDVNDLGFFAGLSIVILMIIIQFTLSRECNNLRIALKAITDRYTPHANADVFKTYIENYQCADGSKSDTAKVLAEINYIRRQHHYNYLSMNEIFNWPPLDVNEKETVFSLTGRMVMKLFWFPVIVYALICANDWYSFEEGWALSPANIIVLFVTELIFLVFITIIAVTCTRLKKDIYSLYHNFKINDYTYTQTK